MNLKRTMLAALVAAVLIPGGLWARGKTGNARIKVDIERQKGEIDRNIYGNFVEHLGRCIYGGLYEPGSPLSDEKGYRRDVLEATRALRTSLVRWPGGNFVSGYHWEDGIGPQAGRPTRIDLAWGFRESNAFGTDEFVEWCRRADTEPYFCVNLGTGTMDEARNWVEYCNVEKGTYWSDLRRRNGYEKPHKVKYWALGNEMDGQWQMGHKNAEDYGKFALETAKLMKWIDRDIKLVVAGSSDYNGNWIDWNRTVLEYLKNHADYIALHNYVENRSNDYYKFMATTRFAEKAIRITEGLIAEAMTKAERKVLSPATSADHEFDHGLDDIASPDEHAKRASTPDAQYDTKEERRVITGSEQKTAKANGEIKGNLPTRRNHKGRDVITTGVTSSVIDPTKTQAYEKRQKEIRDDSSIQWGNF